MCTKIQGAGIHALHTQTDRQPREIGKQDKKSIKIIIAFRFHRNWYLPIGISDNDAINSTCVCTQSENKLLFSVVHTHTIKRDMMRESVVIGVKYKINRYIYLQRNKFNLNAYGYSYFYFTFFVLFEIIRIQKFVLFAFFPQT